MDYFVSQSRKDICSQALRDRAASSFGQHLTTARGGKLLNTFNEVQFSRKLHLSLSFSCKSFLFDSTSLFNPVTLFIHCHLYSEERNHFTFIQCLLASYKNGQSIN